jgi:PIN domain nuclease of toxin-antitoxin system
MRLLLDTQALLWFLWQHANLTTAARNLMTDPKNELLLSAVNYWEIAVKVSIGKLVLSEPFEKFINEAIANNHLTVLPVSVSHAAALIGLPFHHRDPFDRLLVAQAQVEQIPIISADAAFDAYGVQRLW